MKIFKLSHCVILLMALFLGLLLLTSCTGIQVSKTPNGRYYFTCYSNNPESDKISAILWFEYAAEARALYYQAYNVASDRLDAAVAKRGPKDRPLAVIMDIDETILDNTPYQASLVEHGSGFNSKSWKDWVEQARSKDLYGAKAFLQYAAATNVEIFYISKRNASEFEATKSNLLACGLPLVDDCHLLLVPDKEPKRLSLEKEYNVVLLMGDNLDDFSCIFDTYTIQSRFDITDKNREEFGRRFIVLPNPMYGDWEIPLYSHATNQDLTEIRRQWLEQLYPTPCGCPKPGSSYVKTPH